MPRFNSSDSPREGQAFAAAQRVLGPLGVNVSNFSASPRAASWGELHESRKQFRRAMAAMNERVAKEGDRVFTEDEQAAWDLMGTAIRTISDEIDSRQSAGTTSGRSGPNIRNRDSDFGADGRNRSNTDGAESFALTRDERVTDTIAGRFSGDAPPLTSLLRASISGDWSGLEQYRAQQGTETGSAGGFITPTYLAGRVIDLSRAQMRVIQAGALTIPISGTTSFATVDGDPNPEWRAENAPVTEGQVLLGSRLFNPNTLAVLVKASVELVEDAPNADAMIQDSLASALALQLDKMCLVGNGVGKPLGLINTDGVTRIPVNGPLTSYAPLSRAVEAVWDANAEPGDFILSARTAGEIDRLVDENKNPLRPPRSVEERRLLASNQVPNDLTTEGSPSVTDASAIFTGQWSSLYVAIRTNMVLEATRVGGDSFKNMQVWIRGYLRADAFAVRPNHFSIVEGITAPAT